MRRLITACNEFEWVARTKPLSRKGCDMLADVVHESLENYRVLLPPFSYVSLPLSLSLSLHVNPLAAYLQPHPSLRLSPPFIRTRNRFNPRPDNQCNYKTERKGGRGPKRYPFENPQHRSMLSPFFPPNGIFFLSFIARRWRLVSANLGEGGGSSVVLSRRKMSRGNASIAW